MATSQTDAGSNAAAVKSKIHLGTRKSELAMIQTEMVRDQLKKAFPSCEIEIHAMSTMGDKNQVTPLHSFGAKSLWTFELEDLLMKGELDMVVHCVKDMPTTLPPGCRLGAILEREDPRDAVVMKASSSYKSLGELLDGSVVGTSSVRRSSQLKRKYPKLKFESVRGNVGTRLRKLDDEHGIYSCIILAAAGLLRMNLGHRITSYLSSKDGGIYYAVGQGALGIETLKESTAVNPFLRALEHKATSLACLAERSVMRTLEGGCSVPIGVETEWDASGEELTMRALVISLDGSQCVDVEYSQSLKTNEEANEYGKKVAQMLRDKGAQAILDEINADREPVVDPAQEEAVKVL